MKAGIETWTPTFTALRQNYLHEGLTPKACIEEILGRIEEGQQTIWISRVPVDVLAAQAEQLQRAFHEYGEAIYVHLPLFGIPFAVKDNIDVAGLPTTAACPAFAYRPEASAYVVQKLQAAGAILIGKTNLDQFATGLVGTRSPYGAVLNTIDPDYVSGGSSSGSAAAVALGLVSFSLGTDTAGSGRVPAGFNDIVGLKPTPGLLSTRGLLAACRTLDCISIFAHNVEDAWRVMQVAAGYDDEDAYARHVPMLGVKQRGYRIAVPEPLEFFGDAVAANAFDRAIAHVRQLPYSSVQAIPFAPFVEAGKLLYQGPWVAERRASIGAFFDTHADAIDPIVRNIIGQAERFTAVDAFKGRYRLAELKRAAETLLDAFDFIVVPTAPSMPTTAQVEAEPVLRNSELGYYTNFVNLFELAAIAIPGPWRSDGLPAGITLIGPAGSDHRLAVAAQAMQALFTDVPMLVSEANDIAAQPLPHDETVVQVAVVGAHLYGQPLNWQLLERGARKLQSTCTSKNYRLYALADTTPPKPGLIRVAVNTSQPGMAIAIEIWELSERLFGGFVAAVPPPLSIGSIELADGRWIKGFICEPWALNGAKDISAYGGWRAYLDHEVDQEGLQSTRPDASLTAL